MKEEEMREMYSGEYIFIDKMFNAGNTACTPKLLIELSRDPDPRVRKAAESNPNFPKDLEDWSLNLEEWSGSPERALS